MCAYKLKIEAACELANRERVGETRALVWDPLDLHLHTSYGTRCSRQRAVWDSRETQVPLWDPFVSKLVPDETHSSSKLGGGSGFKASILKSPRPLEPEP